MPKTTPGGRAKQNELQEELYRRARELRIEGRSTMTKGQLADAVARRQSRRGRSR
jgi:hypothetical protein